MRFNYFSAGTAVWRTLLALMLLTSPRCAQITQPSEGATGRAASLCRFGRKYFSETMADRLSFENFEISELRWVHGFKGWSWLACVHFTDRGHVRTYAVFIQNDAVVDGRYAVETDACGAQTYTPFDVVTGMVGRPTAPRQLPPLY